MPGPTTHRSLARHVRRNFNRNSGPPRRSRRAPSSTTYLDLKPGELLSIGQRRITLGVRKVGADGSAVAEVRSPFHEGTRSIRRGQYMRLDRTVGVFNYGNRHHGRRMHIRLEFIGDQRPSIEKVPWNEDEETPADCASAVLDSSNHRARIALEAGGRARRR